MARRAWVLLAVAGMALPSCVRRADRTAAITVDAAAESYVRLTLALGERDPDSLDHYVGPAAWQRDARARRAPLADIQEKARTLADSLAQPNRLDKFDKFDRFDRGPDETTADRRAFLVRQLHALVSRIGILRGERPRFIEEARALFDLEELPPASSVNSVLGIIDRELPGRGELTTRYAAFDRQFLIAPDRLPIVLSGAVEACREATRAHTSLPAGEQVHLEFVHDLGWSAFTRYEGGFKSRIRIDAGLPLTVDRALELACHEAYPGHHTINSLIEARFGRSRVEFLVQPLFSPQSLLHEGASSSAATIAFSETARLELERDVLIPLAGLKGLNSSDIERYVRISRLVDQLHGVEADVVRRYLDGDLDFPRASTALAHDALMASADSTLKFVNQYRTYAATYSIGRDLVTRALDAHGQSADDSDARWKAYLDLITSPRQEARSATRRR